MTLRVRVAAMLMAAVVSGCANENLYHPPAGQKVHITQQTYEAFKQYQATIGSTHPGAFAVSRSGRDSYYYYCEDITCVSGSAYGQQAVRACAQWGQPCYIFAYGNKIEYEYEVGP